MRSLPLCRRAVRVASMVRLLSRLRDLLRAGGVLRGLRALLLDLMGFGLMGFDLMGFE